MMQVMRDIGGIDIPTSLATLVGADGAKAEGNGHAKGAAVAAASEDVSPATPVVKPRAQSK
jgi:hypothetical protein